MSAAPTPPSFVPGVVLAAIGTLAFGAVLGPEAPVIALGSAVGVVAHRIVRLGGQEGAVLSAAGSFSAISALFGGPLVAGMLLVESGLSAGSRLIPALLPGLVAAAVGYVIFVGFGSWGGLEAPGLIVPNLPPYEGLHPGDLSMGIAVGVASVLVLTGIRRLAVGIDGLQGRARHAGAAACRRASRSARSRWQHRRWAMTARMSSSPARRRSVLPSTPPRSRFS